MRPLRYLANKGAEKGIRVTTKRLREGLIRIRAEQANRTHRRRQPALNLFKEYAGV